MGFTDNKYATFTAGEALEPYRRVKLSGDRTVVYADAGEKSIGVTRDRVDNGDPVTVRLWNGEGTVMIEAAGAITRNANVYGAADGKVDDVATAEYCGTALQAATAAGEYPEILPGCESVGQAAAVTCAGSTGVQLETAINAIINNMQASGQMAAS